MKLQHAMAVVFDAFKLGLQFIQKQRLDQLQDIRLRGVMRTEMTAHIRIHDALKQAAEDGRADGRPIQGAGLQQSMAQAWREICQRQSFCKQASVHIRKCCQLRV